MVNPGDSSLKPLAGFSPRDGEAHLLFCANGYIRGGKRARVKDQADHALAECPGVIDMILVRRAESRLLPE